jgi:hypothetical protein
VLAHAVDNENRSFDLIKRSASDGRDGLLRDPGLQAQ